MIQELSALVRQATRMLDLDIRLDEYLLITDQHHWNNGRLQTRGEFQP